MSTLTLILGFAWGLGSAWAYSELIKLALLIGQRNNNGVLYVASIIPLTWVILIITKWYFKKKLKGFALNSENLANILNQVPLKK